MRSSSTATTSTAALTAPPGTRWARPRRSISSSTGGAERALLERLRGGEQATWQPYDWDADDGRLAGVITAGPAAVVVLDGAYSARPELADLFDLRVLLDLGRDARRERLLRREGARDRAEWEARWGEAEDLYFERLMPPDAFDLVLDGDGR